MSCLSLERCHFGLLTVLAVSPLYARYTSALQMLDTVPSAQEEPLLDQLVVVAQTVRVVVSGEYYVELCRIVSTLCGGLRVDRSFIVLVHQALVGLASVQLAHAQSEALAQVGNEVCSILQTLTRRILLNYILFFSLPFQLRSSTASAAIPDVDVDTVDTADNTADTVDAAALPPGASESEAGDSANKSSILVDAEASVKAALDLKLHFPAGTLHCTALHCTALFFP